MQQRRLRPGDVLDDYCPRERRITDHAIVAMIDDNIKQTRCVVCDAEHEYKQAKVPPQRRKKTPALFNQVLDGLQGPVRPPQLPDVSDDDPELSAEDESDVVDEPAASPTPLTISAAVSSDDNGNGAGVAASPAVDDAPASESDELAVREEGPVRRQLIRAALPRPEGQPTQPTRAMPEFTIRQPMNGRGARHAGGGGRRGQHQPQQGGPGPTRFGRGGGQGGRSQGQRGQGFGGQTGNRMNGGGSRRGGKKGR